MTDIQLPVNTSHQQQKGGVINGKLIAKASNLEIRGGGVSLIGNSSAAHPNHSGTNNESTISTISAPSGNKSMSSSQQPRRTGGHHQQSSASSNQNTVVSVNIIDFKQPIGLSTTTTPSTSAAATNATALLSSAAQRRQRNNNNSKAVARQQNRVNQTTTGGAIKRAGVGAPTGGGGLPLELTLSSSRLMLAVEATTTAAAAAAATTNTAMNNPHLWWSSESINNPPPLPPVQPLPSNMVVITATTTTTTTAAPVDNNNCCSSNSAAAWATASAASTTTGVMSDRSSVYSIDGDFDREASHKVNKQLRDIEAILYEQQLGGAAAAATTVSSFNNFNRHNTHANSVNTSNTNNNNNNLNECKEWSLKFPHLSAISREEQEATARSSILNNLTNTKLAASNNSLADLLNLSMNNPNLLTIKNASKQQQIANNQVVNEQRQQDPNASTTTTITPSNSRFSRRRENTDLNNQGIYLNGQTMSIRKIDHLESSSSSSKEYRFLEEEIFEQEGTYEELLAYDNQEEEYLVEHNKRLNLTKRRRHGLPPITPKAAMRDLVNNFLFDFMWSAIIDWSMSLIKEYAKTIVDGQINLESLTRTNTEISTTSVSHKPLNNNNNNNQPILPTLNSSSSQQQQQQQQQQINNLSIFNMNTINSMNKPNPSSSSSAMLALNPIQIQAIKAVNASGGVHVPLKPFDPPVNNINGGAVSSAVAAANNQSTQMISDKQVASFTPGLMSRDNSTLVNSQLSRFNTVINSSSGEYLNEGKLVDEAIPKFLQIKQINAPSSSASKNLAPLSTSVSRVSSGKQQSQQPTSLSSTTSSSSSSATPMNRSQHHHHHHQQMAKKRFSSVEIAAGQSQQQQQHPTSSSALGLATTTPSTNSIQASTTNTTTTISTAGGSSSSMMTIQGNAFGHAKPSSGSGGGGGGDSSPHGSSTGYGSNHHHSSYHNPNYHHTNASNNSRAANDDIGIITAAATSSASAASETTSSSTMLISAVDSGIANEIMSIDEINLIGGSSGFLKQNQAHVHFQSYQNQQNNVHHLHQLPPISNSLKPLRISSANNLNTNKEKSERPLTSTAIRMDNFPFNKRSTTPSGFQSSNKTQNYYQSIKKRFNVSLDDPFHTTNNSNINALNIVNSLNNFLSTKSLASINNSTTNALNRRNSIKESRGGGGIHK